MKCSTSVVITAEGLGTSGLSCYGSSWNETPELDALASSACLWDRLVATSSNPLDVLKSWIGTETEPWRVAQREQGPLELFTDDARVAEQEFASRLDRVDLVSEKTQRPRTRPCERIEQTRMGRLFAAALNRMEQPDCPSLLWIHTCSLVSSWDAPRSLALVDDLEAEDAGPSDEVEFLEAPSDGKPVVQAPVSVFATTTPPQLRLDPSCHPDLVVSWMRTYGCQVRLLDVLVGLVRDFEPLTGANFVVAGTSGFALGENGWIGAATGPIRSNRIRLPLLISQPHSLRVPQLTSSDDVPLRLARLVSGSEPVLTATEWAKHQTDLEPRIETANGAGVRLINSPAWFLVEELAGNPFLFLKPDDVGDVNDVSKLRDDVVQMLGDENSASMLS